jgi:hypothetical protein
LQTAGVALAKRKHGGTQSDAVLATFTVTQAAVNDRTCTGADGEYKQFHAVCAVLPTRKARGS